mgnify:CR=1 FL=1
MIQKDKISEIIDSLSPLERKIIPYLKYDLNTIINKSGLDQTSVLRGLMFLENKNIIKISKQKKTIIDLGTNGIYYKKNHLPERNLLMLLGSNSHLSINEAKSLSKLSDNEFKVALGVLKQKALINISNGKISLNASKEEITKRFLEEKFLDILPVEKEKLEPEQLHSFENLKKRKDIIEMREESIVEFKLTDLGKDLAGKEIKSELIEELTPDIIKTWNKIDLKGE